MVKGEEIFFKMLCPGIWNEAFQVRRSKTAAVRENEIIPLIFSVFFVKDKPTSSFIVQTRNKKCEGYVYDNEILTSLSGRPNQHKDR